MNKQKNTRKVKEDMEVTSWWNLPKGSLEFMESPEALRSSSSSLWFVLEVAVLSMALIEMRLLLSNRQHHLEWPFLSQNCVPYWGHFRWLEQVIHSYFKIQSQKIWKGSKTKRDVLSVNCRNHQHTYMMRNATKLDGPNCSHLRHPKFHANIILRFQIGKGIMAKKKIGTGILGLDGKIFSFLYN